MIELIHKILLWIHIPFGTLSLILFWIPVGVRKGGAQHRQMGWYYFVCMWIVLVSALLLSICNTILGNYMSAIYLGYLSIITAYPLWYSYEILQQKKEWAPRYFAIRRAFVTILFITGLAIISLAAIKYQFQGIGMMMAFFGLLAIPAGRDLFMSREKAMSKETKLKMHIQGTIISGIAAYTAFFAFGGSRLLLDVLQMHPQWMVVPWVAPTMLGVIYFRYMQRKYQVA